MTMLLESTDEIVASIQSLTNRVSTLSNYLVSKLDTDAVDMSPEEIATMEKIIAHQMIIIKKLLANREFSSETKRELQEFMLSQSEWADINQWQQDLVLLKEKREQAKTLLMQS